MAGSVTNANARPTIEAEMAKFTTFTSKDGETIDPKGEDLNPVANRNTTEGEDKVLANMNGTKEPKTTTTETTDTTTKSVKLTDDESNDAIAELDTRLGREATEEEISAELKSKQTAKDKAAGVKAKPTRSVQERINFAVKNQRKAERRADAAEAALAAERANKTAPLTGETKTANNDSNADAAPDPKKFEFGELDAGYIRALARYEAKQELAEQSNKQKQTQQTKEQSEQALKFKALRAAFEDKGNEEFDDFDEVVIQGAANGEWPLSPELGAVIMDSEFGPQVAYELAGDLALAKKVNAMSPMRQVAWLGRREAELSAGSGAKTETEAEKKAKAEAAAKLSGSRQVKETKAPLPVTRARGNGSNSSVSGDTNDFAAFEAAAMGRNKP